VIQPGARPKMVVKIFVVTVVGSLKRLAVAVMRTGAVVVTAAVTVIRDILPNWSKDR
jgi:branched-subunit amino acid ABC-type transport system permease component